MATVTKRRGKSTAKSAAKNGEHRSKSGKATEKKSSGKPGKLIYFFSKSKTDGNGSMKPLLGGKGANLAAMTSIGLPVPPGFTITTEVCTYYYKNGKKFPPTLLSDIKLSVSWLEKETGKKFGDTKNPLLVSVRSGSGIQCPA